MMLVVFCLVLIHLGLRIYDHAIDISIFAAVIRIADSSMVSLFCYLCIHFGDAALDILLRQFQCECNILIAADPKGVLFSELLLHYICDILQHLIAGFVSLCVVQLVQTIDVNINTADRMLIHGCIGIEPPLIAVAVVESSELVSLAHDMQLVLQHIPLDFGAVDNGF